MRRQIGAGSGRKAAERGRMETTATPGQKITRKSLRPKGNGRKGEEEEEEGGGGGGGGHFPFSSFSLLLQLLLLKCWRAQLAAICMANRSIGPVLREPPVEGLGTAAAQFDGREREISIQMMQTPTRTLLKILVRN